MWSCRRAFLFLFISVILSINTYSQTTPSLTVVTPNGGESWTAGSAHTITWTATGLSGNVSIALMKAGVGYRSIAASVPATSGSFSWTMPTSLPAANDYTVRVMSADGANVDLSDAPFNITPGPSITVTSPNGGEIWRMGGVAGVYWNAVGLTGTVNIALLKGGLGVRGIASGWPAASGSVGLSIPIDVAVGNDYTVRVTSADGKVVDVSDANFSILGNIRVGPPNGGEAWPLGSTQTIQWGSYGVTGNVSVTLMKGGVGFMSIATSVPVLPGSLKWVVPTNLPIASDYTVRVMATDGETLDVSDNTLSIVAPTGIVKVLTPNGGESWPLGSTQSITWSSTGLTGNVSLTLMKSGRGYKPIAASVPATQGTFNWTLPTNLPIASDYTVRVLSTNGVSVDVSDATFSIVPGGTIKVLSPNGGESWPAGSAHNITWTSTGVTGNVNLALLKAGAGYMSIATNVPAAQGTFNWTLPTNLPIASDYTVRVMSTNGASVDVSNAAFSITPAAGTLTVLSPNGGDTWATGSAQTITWTATNVTGNVNIALMKAGAAYRSIATNVPATQGSYSWTVPATTPEDSNYSVRVMSASTIVDYSDATFSVVARTFQVSGVAWLTNDGYSGLPNANISIDTVPPQNTITGLSGSFSFPSVPNGNYTLTVSVPGANTVFYPSPTQKITVAGQNVIANFAVAAGYTVSGTVNYTGARKGRIYISLGSLGTNIAAPGDFSIQGVPPGTYYLQAWMDTLNSGAINGADPSATITTITVPGPNLTLNLTDPKLSSMASLAPGFDRLKSIDSAVMAWINPIWDPLLRVEVPTSYTIEWSTSSTFTTFNSKTFIARSGQTPLIIGGLTNGATLYFRMRGQNATETSQTAVYPTAVTINPSIGANVVSGAITFPGTATGPMYVGFYDRDNDNIYAVTIPHPVSPQPYTVIGVPSAGSYLNFAYIDQNNNGEIDTGDLGYVTRYGPPALTIGGPTVGQDITLSGANMVARVTTGHLYLSLFNAGPADDYRLSFKLQGVVKMPIAAVLVSGPDVLAPMDLAMQLDVYGDLVFESWLTMASVRPQVGGTYSFQVTYSDGTIETVNATVSGVLDITNMVPSGNVPGNVTPTFSWTGPSTAVSPYYYWFTLREQNGGTIWNLPNNGLPSTITSIAWGIDTMGTGNLPIVNSLTPGKTYQWMLDIGDSDGNAASLQASFTP